MSTPPNHFTVMRAGMILGVLAFWAVVVAGLGGHGPAHGLGEPWQAAVDWSLAVTEVLRS